MMQYDAVCHALFEYWKYASSDEWKEIVRREIEKMKEREGEG